MTSDGTKVFFTTTDVPSGASESDTAQTSPADVGSTSAELTRLSTGGPAPATPTPARRPRAGTRSPVKTTAMRSQLAAPAASQKETARSISSLEALDGVPTHGTQARRICNVARPQSSPRFVATIHTAVGKPPLPARILDVWSFTARRSPDRRRPGNSS